MANRHLRLVTPATANRTVTPWQRRILVRWELCVPKIRFGNSGDEGRREQVGM